MAIADTSISVDVWEEVKNKIVAAAPYVSNSSTSATTAASINAVFNDKTPTRPQIIVVPPMIDEDGYKFGGTYGKKMINVVVECYYSNTLGVSQLYDQVYNALGANDIAGVDLIAVSSDYGFNSPGDNKYHVMSATFTYERE